jgi:2-keto-4-pentenoate hydratase/2-oxohepta-3-ene-1,7-dioic acid hydratase in catechol pathway
MKLIRFLDEGGALRIGEPEAEGKARLLRGGPLGPWETTDELVSIGRLQSPIDPVNLICIGRNYRAHAKEGGAEAPSEPQIFSKLTSSVIAHCAPIHLPREAPDEVDWEAELAVVIGREARGIPEAEALDHVLGYTCANDVSARDCQKRRDLQWTRGKSFDTFCPLGPALVIDPTIRPNELHICSRLNGETMQDASTDQMMFSVPFLISYLSHQFTLLPGTVILTGTPAGVGFARKPPVFLRPGDTITVEIEGIGELSNPVLASS